MQIHEMTTAQQINHHLSIYDRLATQKKLTTTDVMLMKEHANSIIAVVGNLAVEAEGHRQKMMKELGVVEIQPNA